MKSPILPVILFVLTLWLSCNPESKDLPGEGEESEPADTLISGDTLIVGDSIPSSTDTLEKPAMTAYGPPADLIILEGAIHFYVMGDFGRRGEHGQSELARMMDTVSSVLPPDFVITTGDNFYPDGVTSTTDTHWRESFEDIYPTQNGLACSWYMILGNHDYHGNIQAQIEYSSLSERWTMPGHYYHRDFEKNGASIRMLFLDTNPFIDPYYGEGKFKNKVILQDTSYYLHWMDSLFSDNPQTWKIAVGHHPIYSGDSRGDELQSMKKHLAPHLKSNNVDVYFNGHEHVIHHAKPEGPTHFFTTGAGSKTSDATVIPETLFTSPASAFVVASVTADSIYCQVIDYKGEILYQTGIKK